MYGKLFYDPARPSAFSALQKLQAAVVANKNLRKAEGRRKM
jgi:hypothetical protein